MTRNTSLLAVTALTASHLLGCSPPTEPDPGDGVCVGRESDMDLDFSVSAAQPPGGQIAFNPKEINASCDVWGADASSISLYCSRPGIAANPVQIVFTQTPGGFEHRIEFAGKVNLDYAETEHGKFLVLRYGATELVLLVGDTSFAREKLNDIDIELGLRDDICDSPCEKGASCDDPHRLGLTFGEDGATVLDGNSGEIRFDKHNYDVFVARAESYACLNCSDNVNIAIVRAD